MFNTNKKLINSLLLLLVFKMAWISALFVSCSRSVVSENQHFQLKSNFIDYDCDNEILKPQDLTSLDLTRRLNEQRYFANIISSKTKNNAIKQKLNKCIKQNFVKADQVSNVNFKKFTSSYLEEYNDFKLINNRLKKATHNKVDFDKILKYLANENQGLFMQTIVNLYNVLAKLIGSKIVPYLIFDLMVVKDQYHANNALATAIAYSSSNQVIKSCIVYSKEAIFISYLSILQNYANIIWSSANRFHPIIHEFAHSLDYFTRMSQQNRFNLPFNIVNSNKLKCNSEVEQTIWNSYINKKNPIMVERRPTFSTAAFDLQEYLFVNIRNHHLENNEQSKKILASLIVPSEYGNENNRSEFFAEAFVYWFATLENDRGRNWQILNRFFLEYFKLKYHLH